MITRARTSHGVKLTFSLDLDRPVSVVGDFNGWDPDVHPLKPRTNGRRSAAVTVPLGSRYAFRYLADGGHFFDDPEADGFEDNGYGGTHGVLVLDAPAHPVARPAGAKPTKAAPAPARNGTKASRPAASARPTASRTAKKPKT